MIESEGQRHTGSVRLEQSTGPGSRISPWQPRNLDERGPEEYPRSKETEWQVNPEWLYLGREPVLRYEGGVAYALARDHLGSVRAEARADEKGQPVIHRAGYREMGTLLNSDAVELRSRPKPRPPSAATG